jgi:hypothetical protein
MLLIFQLFFAISGAIELWMHATSKPLKGDRPGRFLISSTMIASLKFGLQIFSLPAERFHTIFPRKKTLAS